MSHARARSIHAAALSGFSASRRPASATMRMPSLRRQCGGAPERRTAGSFEFRECGGRYALRIEHVGHRLAAQCRDWCRQAGGGDRRHGLHRAHEERLQRRDRPRALDGAPASRAAIWPMGLARRSTAQKKRSPRQCAASRSDADRRRASAGWYRGRRPRRTRRRPRHSRCVGMRRRRPRSPRSTASTSPAVRRHDRVRARCASRIERTQSVRKATWWPVS